MPPGAPCLKTCRDQTTEVFTKADVRSTSTNPKPINCTLQFVYFNRGPSWARDWLADTNFSVKGFTPLLYGHSKFVPQLQLCEWTTRTQSNIEDVAWTRSTAPGQIQLDFVTLFNSWKSHLKIFSLDDTVCATQPPFPRRTSVSGLPKGKREHAGQTKTRDTQSDNDSMCLCVCPCAMRHFVPQNGRWVQSQEAVARGPHQPNLTASWTHLAPRSFSQRCRLWPTPWHSASHLCRGATAKSSPVDTNWWTCSISALTVAKNFPSTARMVSLDNCLLWYNTQPWLTRRNLDVQYDEHGGDCFTLKVWFATRSSSFWVAFDVFFPPLLVSRFRHLYLLKYYNFDDRSFWSIKQWSNSLRSPLRKARTFDISKYWLGTILLLSINLWLDDISPSKMIFSMKPLIMH